MRVAWLYASLSLLPDMSNTISRSEVVSQLGSGAAAELAVVPPTAGRPTATSPPQPYQ